MLDVAEMGDGYLAVGERGHVLLSPDGQRWTQVVVPVRSLLCAVATVGDRAWAVGHDSVVLFSGDGGANWAVQYEAVEDEAPLFDVWFADQLRGIAVGAYGTYLATSDGGATWNQRDIDEEGPHFFDLARAPSGSLYMAGEFGTLMRSDDQGENWTKLPSPYRGTFFGMLPVADSTLLAFGLRGNVYRSEDAGNDWVKVPTNVTFGLLGGCLRSDGTVVLVGLSGAVLESTDTGRTFVNRSREDRVGLSSVIDTHRGLLAAGEHGVITLQLDGEANR